ASRNYSFSGSGGIANYTSGPATALTQTGTGILTVSTVNTYTGATTIGTGIDSPTLTLSDTGRIASTGVVVNAGAPANTTGPLPPTTPAVTANGTVAFGASNASN